MERELVLSLYRRPGELADVTLARIASLPASLTADRIGDPDLRKQLELILSNAWGNELATTTTLAVKMLKLDSFELASGIASVDPSGLPVYVEAVLRASDTRALQAVVREAKTLAAENPAEAARDDIYTKLSSLEMSTEVSRLMSISDRSRLGRRLIAERQALLTSGEPRVAFPVEELNEMIPYLMPGWMILVQAEGGVGKSSFAGQMADYTSKRGMSVLTIHFEDTPEMMDARQTIRQSYREGEGSTLVSRLLGFILTADEMEHIDSVHDDVESWGDNSYEFYAGGMTMEAACHVWRQVAVRGRYSGNKLRLVIIDYLNKATITPEKSRTHSGLFGARGYDTELVKQAAEETSVVAVLLQQEVNDIPYETKQGWQKSQVNLSLQREKTARGRNPYGIIDVRKANLGRCGEIPVDFIEEGLLWR